MAGPSISEFRNALADGEAFVRDRWWRRRQDRHPKSAAFPPPAAVSEIRAWNLFRISDFLCPGVRQGWGGRREGWRAGIGKRTPHPAPRTPHPVSRLSSRWHPLGMHFSLGWPRIRRWRSAYLRLIAATAPRLNRDAWKTGTPARLPHDATGTWHAATQDAPPVSRITPLAFRLTYPPPCIPKGCQLLAGGKRSATTGYTDTPQKASRRDASYEPEVSGAPPPDTPPHPASQISPPGPGVWPPTVPSPP